VRVTHDVVNVPIDAPANSAFAITPSDTEDLPSLPRSIYVGSGGNITVDMWIEGTSIEFVGVPTGATLSIRPRRIYDTGTTASSIVGLF